VPASDTSATDRPPGSYLVGIVFVVGIGPDVNAVAVEQDTCNAGIFAGKDIGSRQRFQRPQRNVAEIADRRRDKIESGFQRTGGDRNIMQPIGSHLAAIARSFVTHMPSTPCAKVQPLWARHAAWAIEDGILWSSKGKSRNERMRQRMPLAFTC
jgi:hypothetical protein